MLTLIKKSGTTNFFYPEVVSNNFRFRHSVDDHNAKRHSPIYLDYVRATKYWPHRLFSFLLVINGVNTNLTEAHFVHHAELRPQFEFRKLLAKDLIDIPFLAEEQNKFEFRCSKQQCTIHSHSLLSLSPQKNSKDQKSFKLQVNIIRLDFWGTQKS